MKRTQLNWTKLNQTEPNWTEPNKTKRIKPWQWWWSSWWWWFSFDVQTMKDHAEVPKTERHWETQLYILRIKVIINDLEEWRPNTSHSYSQSQLGVVSSFHSHLNITTHNTQHIISLFQLNRTWNRAKRAKK